MFSPAKSSQRLRDGFAGDAEFFEDGVARGANAEAVDTDDLALSADVFPPEAGDTGFDGDTLGAGGGEHAFAILGALAVEAFHARHGDNTDARLAFGTFDGPLNFGTGGDDDGFERGGFHYEDITTFERAFTTSRGACSTLMRQILATECEQGRAVIAAEGGSEGGCGFFGIAGADDVEIWDDAQTADGLDGLVSWAVFTNADGVVRENIGDRQFGQSGDTDARAAVVSKDEEGGAASEEETVVGDAVADRAHGVLADAKPDVAAGAVAGGEVATAGDVVLCGAEECRRCR